MPIISTRMKKTANGFTLLEVLIALGVVSVAFTAVIGLFTQSARMARESTERFSAAYLARLALDDIFQRIDENPYYLEEEFEEGIRNIVLTGDDTRDMVSRHFSQLMDIDGDSLLLTEPLSEDETERVNRYGKGAIGMEEFQALIRDLKRYRVEIQVDEGESPEGTQDITVTVYRKTENENRELFSVTSLIPVAPEKTDDVSISEIESKKEKYGQWRQDVANRLKARGENVPEEAATLYASVGFSKLIYEDEEKNLEEEKDEIKELLEELSKNRASTKQVERLTLMFEKRAALVFQANCLLTDARLEADQALSGVMEELDRLQRLTEQGEEGQVSANTVAVASAAAALMEMENAEDVLQRVDYMEEILGREIARTRECYEILLNPDGAFSSGMSDKEQLFFMRRYFNVLKVDKMLQKTMDGTQMPLRHGRISGQAGQNNAVKPTNIFLDLYQKNVGRSVEAASYLNREYEYYRGPSVYEDFPKLNTEIEAIQASTFHFLEKTSNEEQDKKEPGTINRLKEVSDQQDGDGEDAFQDLTNELEKERQRLEKEHADTTE